MNIGLIDVDGHNDYDGVEPTAEQKRLARWVNMRAAFQSCSFEEYMRRENT